VLRLTPLPLPMGEGGRIPGLRRKAPGAARSPFGKGRAMTTRLIRKLALLGDGLYPVLGSASAGILLFSLAAFSQA
jgi:hypothetical protein